MDKDTENCLSPNLFHYLLPNIRRMDPTRFAFREHDEIERIEKGKRAFGMFLLCRGKSQSGVKLALQCFLQSGLCISTRLAGAGPLVIRTGIS